MDAAPNRVSCSDSPRRMAAIAKSPTTVQPVTNNICILLRAAKSRLGLQIFATASTLRSRPGQSPETRPAPSQCVMSQNGSKEPTYQATGQTSYPLSGTDFDAIPKALAKIKQRQKLVSTHSRSGTTGAVQTHMHVGSLESFWAADDMTTGGMQIHIYVNSFKSLWAADDITTGRVQTYMHVGSLKSFRATNAYAILFLQVIRIRNNNLPRTLSTNVPAPLQLYAMHVRPNTVQKKNQRSYGLHSFSYMHV
jgi:hypothetical protein